MKSSENHIECLTSKKDEKLQLHPILEKILKTIWLKTRNIIKILNKHSNKLFWTFEHKNTNAEREYYSYVWNIHSELSKLKSTYWQICNIDIHWDNWIAVFKNEIEKSIIPFSILKWLPAFYAQSIKKIPNTAETETYKLGKNELWVLQDGSHEWTWFKKSFLYKNLWYNLPIDVAKVYDFSLDEKIKNEDDWKKTLRECIYYAWRDQQRKLYIRNLDQSIDINLTKDFLWIDEERGLNQINQLIVDNWEIFCVIEHTKNKDLALYKISKEENWYKSELITSIEWSNWKIKIIKAENWDLVRTKYNNWTTYLHKGNQTLCFKWQLIKITEISDNYNRKLSNEEIPVTESEQYFENKVNNDSKNERILWNKYHRRNNEDTENHFELIFKVWEKIERVVV